MTNPDTQAGSEIDTYIAAFPEAVQALLQAVRATIRQAAPEAAETISYGIPTFTLHGNLVHCAGYKQHIGFYPGGAGIELFEAELADYKHAKGSVQFPLSASIPHDLIRRIVAFRVQQNMARAAAKGK